MIKFAFFISANFLNALDFLMFFGYNMIVSYFSHWRCCNVLYQANTGKANHGDQPRIQLPFTHRSPSGRKNNHAGASDGRDAEKTRHT